MSSARVRHRQAHSITPWKNIGFYLCLLLFFLSSFSYFSTPERSSGDWLWPLMFVPLILYFLGIIYGDVPSRYYKLSALTPFPIPFSMQFDRAVMAIVLLFSGITLNGFFLLLSYIFDSDSIQKAIYGIYMVIILFELPHSIRIFRYLQHIQIMRMSLEEAPSLFKEAQTYMKTHQGLSTDNNEFLKVLHQSLHKESEDLVQKFSPLRKEQQIALNLAVRGGEAIWEARNSCERSKRESLEANLNIVHALCKFSSMEQPDDLDELDKTLVALKKEVA